MEKESTSMHVPHTGRWLVILAILLLFTSLPAAFSQESENALEFLNPSDKSVTIPFRMINNLIIIPIFINNSDTLFFILDTGINNTIMTELSADESLSLNFSRQIKLQGLGKGDPIDALHSTGNSFLISGIVGYNQDLYVLLQNIFNLSTLLGTKVHGLLGYDLFRNFVVEINYDKKEIILYDPAKYRYRKSSRSQTLAISLENTKPYIRGEVELEDHTVIPVKLMVDLGASHALWIDKESDPRLKIPSKIIPAFLGTGLSGQISGEIGRIARLRIGKFSFEGPITAFPDSYSITNTSRLDNRNGSIGSEILRRFTVIIDYSNRQITLTPNKHFKDYFRINMSGIEVEASIPGLPIFEISYIRKNSPAARAGLRRGDQIISINNKDAFSLNINKIYDAFASQPGKKIKMVVKRNGQRFRTIFYLEDWI